MCKASLVARPACCMLLTACYQLGPVQTIPGQQPHLITFTAAKPGDALTIKGEAADGAPIQCGFLPCDQNLVSGVARIAVTGSSTFLREVLIPDRRAIVMIDTGFPIQHRVGTGLLWGGLAGMGLDMIAGMGILAGLILNGTSPPGWAYGLVGVQVGADLATLFTGLGLWAGYARRGRLIAREPRDDNEQTAELPNRRPALGTIPAKTEDGHDAGLDVQEVTTADYEACVQKTSCSQPGQGTYCNYGVRERLQHPINCVNLKQAEDYCRAHGWRLPTAAEWRQAAANVDVSKAHLAHESSHAPTGTRKVCAEANTGAACDLLGNVWEWVREGYAVGGGWDSLPTHQPLVDLARNVLRADAQLTTVGFRCARSPAPKGAP